MKLTTRVIRRIEAEMDNIHIEELPKFGPEWRGHRQTGYTIYPLDIGQDLFQLAAERLAIGEAAHQYCHFPLWKKLKFHPATYACERLLKWVDLGIDSDMAMKLEDVYLGSGDLTSSQVRSYLENYYEHVEDHKDRAARIIHRSKDFYTLSRSAIEEAEKISLDEIEEHEFCGLSALGESLFFRSVEMLQQFVDMHAENPESIFDEEEFHQGDTGKFFEKTGFEVYYPLDRLHRWADEGLSARKIELIRSAFSDNEGFEEIFGPKIARYRMEQENRALAADYEAVNDASFSRKAIVSL